MGKLYRGVNHSEKSCAPWTEIPRNPEKSLEISEIPEISRNPRNL